MHATFYSSNHWLQELIDFWGNMLKITILIFDTDGYRIAATDRFKSQLNERVPQNYPALQSIRYNQTIQIHSPGEEPICEPCIFRKICEKKAALHLPLAYDDTILGTMSVFWYRKPETPLFTPVIGNLQKSVIAAFRIRENRLLQSNSSVFDLEEFESISNRMEDGVLLLDQNFFVLSINNYALRKFDRERYLVVGKHISSYLPALSQDILTAQNTGMLPIAVDNQIIEINYRLFKPEPSVRSYTYLLLLKTTTYWNGTEQAASHRKIIGHSPQMLSAINTGKQVAKTHATVLIQGESGTGKDLIAQLIHENSPRADKPFVAVNLSAIPEQLLESELFGYESGTFTGASKNGKIGLFQAAHTGTIFLDEIGELSLPFQVKLLRVLENKSIRRIGNSTEIPIDVRVIAATNQDLKKLVEEHHFRADLYYRLNVIPLTLPSLRERKEDLDLLCPHFIEIFNREFGTEIWGIEPGVLPLLRNYDWPGNIRELKNIIEYAVAMETTHYIRVNTIASRFPADIGYANRSDHEPSASTTPSPRDAERQLIIDALNRCGWTTAGKRLAAKELGTSMSTLYRKIKEYEIQKMQDFKQNILQDTVRDP